MGLFKCERCERSKRSAELADDIARLEKKRADLTEIVSDEWRKRALAAEAALRVQVGSDG